MFLHELCVSSKKCKGTEINSVVELCDLPAQFLHQVIFCTIFHIFQELKEICSHLHNSVYDEQDSDDAVTYELTRKVVEACHLSKRKSLTLKR